jgi:hypothetical protein
VNETPENLSAEEKEAWEKSLTAGSLPTWWKPNPADPAAAGTAPPPATPAPPPAAATTPPPPAPAAPPPAAAPEPLVKNAPPDWEHSRTAGSLPTWWKPGDPPPTSEAPPLAAAAPPPAAAAPPPAAATPPPAAPIPPVAATPPVPAAPNPPRDSETLHLERSPLEAATAPAPPPPAAPADPFQRTMVMGTFPAAPRMASVTVRSGPDTGAKFALQTSPLYVGRAPDNGIVVNDPATSRRHARFELRGQDFVVVDLGSANGTLVDGARVVERVLASGAVITMGQNEFVVTIS